MSDKLDTKILDDTVARQIAFDEEGTVPLCHICNSDSCYTMTIHDGNKGQTYMVRNFLMEKEGPLCVDCYNWMQNSGTYVTKFLHMVLRVKVWLHKLGKRS